MGYSDKINSYKSSCRNRKFYSRTIAQWGCADGHGGWHTSKINLGGWIARPSMMLDTPEALSCVVNYLWALANVSFV